MINPQIYTYAAIGIIAGLAMLATFLVVLMLLSGKKKGQGIVLPPTPDAGLQSGREESPFGSVEGGAAVSTQRRTKTVPAAPGLVSVPAAAPVLGSAQPATRREARSTTPPSPSAPVKTLSRLAPRTQPSATFSDDETDIDFGDGKD